MATDGLSLLAWEFIVPQKKARVFLYASKFHIRNWSRVCVGYQHIVVQERGGERVR